MSDQSISSLVQLTASITESYVGNNTVDTATVGNLIAAIYQALESAGQPAPAVEASPVPAVSARASVKPDYLVCMECGAKQKMLKRHLMNAHGLSPTEYRDKWKLGRTYPMVAADYAEQRRGLAVSIGLGKGNRKTTAKAITKPARKAAKSVSAGLAAAREHLGGDA